MYDLLDAFIERYRRPGHEFDIVIARLILAFVLIWKLLSRNFSFYAYLPDGMARYPSALYPAHSIKWWTGGQFTTDLLTFHWPHWFLPAASPTFIGGVQVAALIITAVWAVFGDRLFRWTPMILYVLLAYLWGYIFRTGQEVDSVALYFGVLLVLALRGGSNEPVFKLPKLAGETQTLSAGIARSHLILVFVAYYFASGMRKISDISPVGWLQYDLIALLERSQLIAQHTTQYAPPIFANLLFLGDWGRALSPLVYLSHLLVPLVYFNRGIIPKMFLFYAIFHVMTIGVGITFSGYVFVWSCLFPFATWLNAARGADPENVKGVRYGR